MLSPSVNTAQATSGKLAAENLSRQGSQYHRDHFSVKHLFPGRRDRAPARPAAPSPAPSPRQAISADGAVVGLLLLLLCANGNNLTTRQSRAAWEVAEKWTADYVATRHTGRRVTQ